MQHYVHGADGTKYGPADLAMLLEWKAEGRIGPSTMIEPEIGGTPFEAKGLEGLFPELEERQYYGQADWGYAPETLPTPSDLLVQRLATMTWVFGIAAFLCCPLPAGLASIICAVMANARGHRQGKLLIVYAVTCCALALVVIAFASVAWFRERGWLP